jgi:D-glycero-D-manno-heptose 1,7-bisphosphate phosphatase
VFLDRDGVLNEVDLSDGAPRPPRSLSDLRLALEARPAVDQLRAAGFALVVVTNQPDVARGTTPRGQVEAVNDFLRSELALDAVYCCMHDTTDECDCRKPRPGMLHRAALDLGLDLASSWLIGDRWVDIAAARAAGVRGLLLERPYSWEPTSAGAPPSNLEPAANMPTLAACVAHILAPSG